MQVWFYSFLKRANSTKQPPASTDWAPEVNLKGNTSFYNPVLIVGVQSGADVTRHNYLRIDNVCGVSHAYYYIDDWVSLRNDLYEVYCHMDLLATYKDYIRATTAYIQYSDSAGNPMITDNRVALNPIPDFYATFAPLNPPTTNDGSYILYISGKESTGFFALSQNALIGLMSNLSDWTQTLFPGSYEDSNAGIASAVLDGVKQLVSSGGVASNISSCVYVPWRVPGESTPLWLGNFDTGRAGRAVDYSNTTGLVTIDLPGETGTWLDGSGGTTACLYLPYCGTVAINANMLIGRKLEIQTSVQMCTGDIAYSVECGGYMIGTYSGCAGLSIPLGVASVSKQSQVAGLAIADAGLALGGLVAAGNDGNNQYQAEYAAIDSAISSGANKLMSFTNDLGRSYHTVGGIGNGASMGLAANAYVTLSGMRYKPISDPSILGAPTMRTMSLSGLSGYIQCVGAQVQAPTGRTQLAAINANLNNGFYME